MKPENTPARTNLHAHKGWHSRESLPHFDCPGRVQFITCRLHDSVPAGIIEKWKDELGIHQGRNTNDLPDGDPRAIELYRRLAAYEDAGHGACFLRNPQVAAIVQENLLHFDTRRYHLLEWCVMPNHVHLLIATREGHPVLEVAHSWKSYTAKEANKVLNRSGQFWMEDYFDRFIRSETHLGFTRDYIRDNPVRAGLCKMREEWRWGSAHPGQG
jgi:REP element-mobilizing transposase RayT